MIVVSPVSNRMVTGLFLATLGLLVIALGAVLAIRNERVWRFRNRMVDLVFAASISDTSVEAAEKRWADYRQVSYFSMWLQFWRPLDSFFPGDLLRRDNGSTEG